MNLLLLICCIISSASFTVSTNSSLEFVGNPSLFRPLTVKYTSQDIIDSDQLVYLELESRSLDVLPGRENEDWRVIVTRSAPLGVQVEFGCEWVVATGFYRIKATSGNRTFNSPTVKLGSTRPQDAPKLLLREDSIFPHCQHDFDLSWQLPNCTLERKAAADTFRIRVSAVQADGMELYMGELKPTTDFPSHIGIPCAQFDIIYVNFCFELVSLQPYTNQLDLWDRKCIRTEPVLQIDGGWSDWSSFSSCTKSCDGGRRKRQRECNNPKPQNGRFCTGRMVESETCNENKCDKSLPFKPFNITAHKSECECGCILSEKEGAIFIGSSITKCHNQNIEWSFMARYLAKLRLVFLGKLGINEKLKVIDTTGHEMFMISGENMRSTPIITEFPLDSPLIIKYESLDNTSDNSGSLIFEYEVIPAPQPSDYGNEYSALIASKFVECQTKKCHAVMTILSLLVCLVAIMLMVTIPPLICSVITKRRIRGRKRRAKTLLESMRAESEMVRSGGTDSTQLSSNNSASKPPIPPTQFIGKRSIGVQQSAQTTPRQLRSTLETPMPNPSVNSVDLEYDYYDPIVPGSLLRPENGACQYDIDIESIIAKETSGWLSSPMNKQ